MAITEQCWIFASRQNITAHDAQVTKDKEGHQQLILLSYSSAFEVCYPENIQNTVDNFQPRSVTKAQPEN